MVFERVLKGIVIAVEALEYNLRQEVSTNKERRHFVTALLFKSFLSLPSHNSPTTKRPSCKKNVSALRPSNQQPETPQSMDLRRPKHNETSLCNRPAALSRNQSQQRNHVLVQRQSRHRWIEALTVAQQDHVRHTALPGRGRQKQGRG